MKRLLPILIATSMLSGCVTPPKLGPAPVAKIPESYATTTSFAATSAPWPTDRWWSAYGDPQLDGLIAEALADAPTMAQAGARLRKAQANVGVAESATMPSVSADGTFNMTKPSTKEGIPVLPERQGYNDTGRVTLGFSWELDFWGKNRAGLAAARSEAEAAGADAAAARLVVSTAVAAAYADLARLYADRDVLQGTVAVREKTLELVQARVTHGFDSDADLAQAEAGPPAARADLAAVDESIGLTRNRLAALLGKGPDRGLTIERPASPALKAFGLPANLSAELIGRRPDVVAARWRAEAAAKRIKVARAQFYPNVNLIGLIGFSSLGVGHLLTKGSDVGSVGPAISLPIFDADRRRENYKSARADYDLAVASYDDALTQALHDVADAAVSSRQLSPELNNAEVSLGSIERAYRLAQVRYKAGATDYQSVLIIEERLLASRRIVTGLRSRAFIIDVALVRSLGGGVIRQPQGN